MEEALKTLLNFSPNIIISVITSILTIKAPILIKIFENIFNRESNKQKHEYTKEETTHNSLINSMRDTYASSYPKILASYELLWDSMLMIRDNIPPIVSTVYSILRKEEIKQLSLPLSKKDKIIQQITSFDYNLVLEKHINIIDEARTIKPFISITSWNIFEVYSIFYGRLTYLLCDGIKEGEIKIWYEDTHFLDEVLGSVINKNFLDEIIKNEIDLFKYVSGSLEMLIQNEIQGFMLGNKLSNEIIKNLVIKHSNRPPIDKK